MVPVSETVGHYELCGDAIGSSADDFGEYGNGLFAFTPCAGLLKRHLDHGAGHPAILGEDVDAAHADVSDGVRLGRAACEVVRDHSGNIAPGGTAAITGLSGGVEPLLESGGQAGMLGAVLRLRLGGREGRRALRVELRRAFRSGFG